MTCLATNRLPLLLSKPLPAENHPHAINQPDCRVHGNSHTGWQRAMIRPKRLIENGLALFAACLVSGLVSYGCYLLSLREGRSRMEDSAHRQLDLYIATLEGEIKRHASLPGLIEADTQLSDFLQDRNSHAAEDRINERLATLAARASVISLFLVDRHGLVVAANDWRLSGTDYGSRVGERFIIDEALAGKPHHYVVMREPGGVTEVVFIYPFRHEGAVIGLTGFRISLDALESTWRGLGSEWDSDEILVVDDYNLVILSSAPGWKLAGAPDGQLSARLASPFPGQAPYIVHERGLSGMDWKMQYLSNPAVIFQVARSDALGALALCGFMLLLLGYLLQRREAMHAMIANRHALQHANALLEEKVAQRTLALRLVNASLVEEISRREQAQADLIHASRLASLGQMSASVSHEIGQPLTALRALARNARIHAERSNIAALLASLADIGNLADRIGRISMQLKSFAYRGAMAPQRFNVHKALSQSCRQLAERLASEDVSLLIDVADCDVLCDQPRLEQVLLNLMQNGLDAMKLQERRCLTIRGTVRDAWLRLQVHDSGPGIPALVLPRLFEPFFTTKPCGAGLGLGLAICADIVREFGGSLRVCNADEGALFEFDIRLAPACEEQHHGG